MKERLLIADDDMIISKTVIPNLELEGFIVSHKFTIDDSIKNLNVNPPHMVIYDNLMVKKDGFNLCSDIRSKFNGPIMILTSKEDESDHYLLLTAGADDYISKFIHPKLIVARIKALIRRAYYQEPKEPSDIITINNLKIVTSRREVFFKNRLIPLTTLEFNLLHFLATHAGKIVKREDVYQHLNNSTPNGVCRAIDKYISVMRRKLGDSPYNPQLLKTIRGKGYLLMGPATNKNKIATKLA